MSVDFMSKLQQLRRKNRAGLLTLLTVDAHDICLRPAPGSGLFLISRVCNCGIACDHWRGTDHFRQPDRARVDLTNDGTFSLRDGRSSGRDSLAQPPVTALP